MTRREHYISVHAAELNEVEELMRYHARQWCIRRKTHTEYLVVYKCGVIDSLVIAYGIRRIKSKKLNIVSIVEGL